MSLPSDVAGAVAPHLSGPIRQVASVGGGCIAHATRISTDEETFFLKYGRGDVARTFPAEAAGLRALQRAGSPLVIPRLIASGVVGSDAGFLLMTWIERGSRKERFWEEFGGHLAALHRHAENRFGFDRETFIGRLPQRNTWEARWPAFFREHRLEPQVRMARDRGHWQSAWNQWLDALYLRLDEVLPEHPPASLLHGDLWSGNLMVTASGRAALIDPAVYFGHREADLAMTELFGGFPTRFYDAYGEAWPLEPGYALRREVYNLYHLINHLNHFGSGYAGSVASVLQRFV
ncbi:MAG: fructosamine kinase family protein [Rhodothermales bacterium]